MQKSDRTNATGRVASIIGLCPHMKYPRLRRGIFILSVNITVVVITEKICYNISINKQGDIMKKIIVIPDSFKGSLSARRFCRITEKVWREYFPDCSVVSLPLADGGEGTVDCFLAMDGYKRVDLSVNNAYMEPIQVYYAVKGDTAVLEMAMAAGLPAVQGRENPTLTTTYGVGQMIAHAAEGGARKIILGLGGSCTNDRGAGMAAALGVKFYDSEGSEFVPAGGTLDRIKDFDAAKARELLDGVELVAMCDIDNPLYGENGAAYVFAPQKGADSRMVRQLDNNLKYISDVCKNILGRDYSQLPGAGAAGGMGFGVCAFTGGSLKAGVNLILDEVSFEEQIKTADMIITGEGRLDSQTLSGKAVAGIARRAAGVPVVAVAGSALPGYEAVYNQGITAVFTTNYRPCDLDYAMSHAEENLEKTIINIARLLKAANSDNR